MAPLEDCLARALREYEKARPFCDSLGTDVEQREKVRLGILAPYADKPHVGGSLAEKRQMRQRRLRDDLERTVCQQHRRQKYRLVCRHVVAQIYDRPLVGGPVLPTFELDVHAERLGHCHRGETEFRPFVGVETTQSLIDGAHREHPADREREPRGYQPARLVARRGLSIRRRLVAARGEQLFAECRQIRFLHGVLPKP